MDVQSRNGTATLNAAKCRRCESVLIGRHVHDYAICECGAIAVGGDAESRRRVGSPEDIIELHMTDDEVPPTNGRIIGIDFDGTIVESDFPRIGKPVPLAFEIMRYWRRLGARLILYTMRSDRDRIDKRYLSDAVEFCRSNGVEFWGINKNRDQLNWTSSPKVHADLYIDDRAVGAPLRPASDGKSMIVDWLEIDRMVTSVIEMDSGMSQEDSRICALARQHVREVTCLHKAEGLGLEFGPYSCFVDHTRKSAGKTVAVPYSSTRLPVDVYEKQARERLVYELCREVSNGKSAFIVMPVPCDQLTEKEV